MAMPELFQITLIKFSDDQNNEIILLGTEGFLLRRTFIGNQSEKRRNAKNP